MINHNGEITQGTSLQIEITHRALNYGDALFETLKYTQGKILWWESHYFRLMGSMRILRMEIPTEYTMEYLEEQMLETLRAAHMEQQTVRIKLTVYRKGAGKYTPQTREVGFFVQIEPLAHAKYEFEETPCEIELYKDFQKQQNLLATLKTTNSMLYTLASIYKQENGYQEVLLLNTDNKLVEGSSTNLFLVKGNTLKTAPLESGCLKGIMRQNILKWAPLLDLNIEETAATPFELLQADEVWLTNAIIGIRAATLYRKRNFGAVYAQKMLNLINEKADADESTFVF
jgi:branched-chain amino acid aminotransferase